MGHPLFGPEIKMMLLDKNVAGMKAFVDTLNPATVAETLSSDSFTAEEVWEVLGQAQPRQQARVFEFFPIEWQVRMAEGGGRAQMARLIELMSHDDRVDLLRRLPAKVAEALLRLVDEADRRDIANLSRYGENTVGSIMTSDYAWLPADLTAQQAIERLRAQAPDRETIYYVYIVDETSRRMLGILTLRALVLADPATPIRRLMLVNDLVTLRASADQETAADALRRYGLIAIPVLDDEGRLVGMVTHDDIVDVMSQETTEDIQRQAAVGPMREGYLEAPLATVWYSRGKWLALLFVMQMFTINAMLFYEGQLKVLLILAAFIPVCLSVGGNAGSQAAALITRGLALGQVHTSDWLRVLRRELIVGVSLGAMIGVLGLARTWVFTSAEDPDLGGASLAHLSWAIALSVAAICLTGTLVGSLLPLAVARLGGDPAIASVPFIATLSDVLGIVIYFTIAARVVL
jgi:magnesium transporter